MRDDTGDTQAAGGRIRPLLARLLARLRGGAGPRLRKPYVRRHEGFTSLQFVRRQTQSRMVTGDPDRLLVPYTRTMLATLLWQPAPRVLGMVGLGGGSQAKFCHRNLPGTRVEIVENNPHVIALRGAFGVPDDDARLQVVLDDGAAFVGRQPGRFDVLLVDGYDERGIPEALSTQAFYDACHDALRDDGVLACNLYVRNPEAHVARLRRAFGDARVLVVDEPKMSNRVAFAWRGDLPPRDEAAWVARVPEDLRRLLPEVFPRVAARLARAASGPR
ncbi:transferase [Luteimonas sp. BDR2-5]|uniref:spermine/spermidine synthase domain-containing protein n=1 Tax=Proluteimonas luteida TaxID=2878685 RepID=UPI001E5FE57B|nr:transferase [Luteimonas sp. BDR2-5]MCD9028645.1 transferase [Luteimonas sp. BDR2-5]